nr:MAG TPA: hypothetical protein [Caudoviricetes sp.]
MILNLFRKPKQLPIGLVTKNKGYITITNFTDHRHDFKFIQKTQTVTDRPCN